MFGIINYIKTVINHIIYNHLDIDNIIYQTQIEILKYF